MHKIKRKFILIGIVSIVVLALAAVIAVPALAAGFPPWGPRNGDNGNITRVEGTISSIGNSQIVITPTSSGSTSNSDVTLNLTDSTNFTIHGDSWLSSQTSLTSSTVTASLVGDSVSAVYDKTSLDASQIMINMPAPSSAPGNNGFATVQGTLNASGTSITINETGSSVSFNGTSSQAVNIIYNTSSGNNVVQGIMVSNSSQTSGTPSLPTNKNVSTTAGTLRASGTSITISSSVSFSGPTEQEVTIIYNSNTGDVQAINLYGSGQFGRGSIGMPNHNGMNRFGPGTFGPGGFGRE